MTDQLRRVLLAACACLLLALPGRAQDNNQPPEGFSALFNGKDLTGWVGGTTINPDTITDEKQAEWDRKILKHWSTDGIVLVSDGKGPHLVTERRYGDFELWVDWKLTKNGDSGIYLRDVPQVQLWDPTNEKAHKHGSDKGSGGLWNNSGKGKHPSERADKPIGEWNRMFIRMVGPYVTVVLNGKTVVDNAPLDNFFGRNKPVPMTGRIHLQTHGEETYFRNLFVREIPAEEANKQLAEIAGGDKAYKRLFNGKNLKGWIGATSDYEVVDGAIQCKQGRGGNLITQEQYSDFAVRLEFKLPPGGNNGLAIRTPNAKVNPAGAALELQVLDNTHAKYARLKDYQYHGSAYQIKPALRGYLRPVGEWNYQEVRVVGDHIKVDLNGYRILDVKLKQAKPDHPSAGQTAGHFGFCGHNDPVAFRAIRIKEIE